MKVNDLVSHIIAVSSFLTKGSKGLKVIDDVFDFNLLQAPLDVHFSNLWIVGLHIGPGSLMDMLGTIAKKVFVAVVGPNESVIRLKP